jgi:integrase
MSIEKHSRPGWYYVKSYPNGRNGKVQRDLIEGYEAAQALDESLKRNKYNPPPVLRPRLENIVDEYLVWADRYLAAETLVGKRQRLKSHIIPKLGKLRPAEIDQIVLDDYGKNHTAINYRGDVSHLLALISWASKRKLCDRLNFKPELPVYSAPIKALPDVPDVMKFLDAVQKPEHRVCMEMMLYTGLRFHEAKNLKWDNFETDHFMVRKTKTKRDRIVWIPAHLTQWFDDNKLESGYVFSWDGGKTPWCGILRPINSARKASGVYLTPHMFRHLAATIFYQHNNDLYAVSKMLGHSRVTTSEVYARYAADISKQATNAIDYAVKRGNTAKA